MTQPNKNKCDLIRRKLWKLSIQKYIPYEEDVEDEALLVNWVEKGIHPFTGECFGPRSQRSVFDYLTDKQLDEVIKLQQSFLYTDSN
jgi:hypothetical protein